MPPADLLQLSFLFSGPASSTNNTGRPHGLYLYGDVGTGKTMIMDLFYNTLPAHVTHKRRVHFHAFMLDVHKRMHAAKAAGAGDPLVPVARDLAKTHVLCLDEFQVTDIADAMILRRFLDALLEHGVVCVLTSKYVILSPPSCDEMLIPFRVQPPPRRAVQEWHPAHVLPPGDQSSQVPIRRYRPRFGHRSVTNHLLDRNSHVTSPLTP
jgi:hypothetical protein